MIDFSNIISGLSNTFPVMIVSFVFVFLLTPFIGRFAKLIGAVDLAKYERGRSKVTKQKKRFLKKRNVPRLGGLGVSCVFLVMFFYTQGLNTFSISVGIAVLLLTVIGFLDDLHDLHGGIQLIVQIICILIVILAGVRISSIQIFGYFLDFSQFSWVLPFSNNILQFVFPADLITLGWFIVIINAMNWVSGIDALEETMAWVAGGTIMLLAIKFSNPVILVSASIFTSCVLAFWVFNFPPAKILSGTIGNFLYGFLLAIFAIKIDGKMTASILLLALPLVDFAWVMIWRVFKFKVINPFKLLSISGDHHLHHRFLAIGYTKKQVLLIESCMFLVSAIFAYFFAGFNIFAVAALSSIAVLLLFFIFLSYLNMRKKKLSEKLPKGVVAPAEIKKSPDKEYAY